jgi:hypothetical protein
MKTVGLFVFAYAITDIPYYFPPYARTEPDQSFIALFMQAAAVLTLPIVLGLFLWFFPATVVNRIVSGDKLTDGLKIRDFERLAVTIIGIAFVAFGVTDVGYRALSIVVLKQQLQDFPMANAWLGIIAGGVKILVGLILAIGAKGVQHVIARARGEG